MIELKMERTKSTCYKIRFVGRKLSGISYDSKTYDFFILLSEKGFKQEALNSWILFCKFRFNLKFNFVQNFRCFRSLDGEYTQCTLKLRPVKLLFVIFGRLSHFFIGPKK